MWDTAVVTLSCLRLLPPSPQVNTTLETLELNGNVIDYDGITALAEALTVNSSLKVLAIRCVSTRSSLQGALLGVGQ